LLSQHGSWAVPPGFLLYSLIVVLLGTIGLVYYYSFKNFSFYGIHYWCLFM